MTYGGRVITLITIIQHGHADSSKAADQGMATATTKSQLLPHPSPATFCRHLGERRRRRRVFTIMMASHNAEFTTIIKFNCCPLDGRMDGAVIIRHVPRKMRNVLRLMVVPSNVVTLRQLCTFITNSSSSTETQHHLQMHFLAKSPTTNRMTDCGRLDHTKSDLLRQFCISTVPFDCSLSPFHHFHCLVSNPISKCRLLSDAFY